MLLSDSLFEQPTIFPNSIAISHNSILLFSANKIVVYSLTQQTLNPFITIHLSFETKFSSINFINQVLELDNDETVVFNVDKKRTKIYLHKFTQNFELIRARTHSKNEEFTICKCINKKFLITTDGFSKWEIFYPKFDPQESLKLIFKIEIPLKSNLCFIDFFTAENSILFLATHGLQNVLYSKEMNLSILKNNQIEVFLDDFFVPFEMELRHLDPPLKFSFGQSFQLCRNFGRSGNHIFCSVGSVFFLYDLKTEKISSIDLISLNVVFLKNELEFFVFTDDGFFKLFFDKNQNFVKQIVFENLKIDNQQLLPGKIVKVLKMEEGVFLILTTSFLFWTKSSEVREVLKFSPSIKTTKSF